MADKNEIFYGTPAAFNAVLSAWAVTVPEEQVETVMSVLAMQFLERLTMKTPVAAKDGGRARGNWTVTLGRPSSDYDDAIRDGTGGATIAKGQATIDDAPPYGWIWILNNVPYIERLENGWSQQAPTGMLDNTLNELGVQFT